MPKFTLTCEHRPGYTVTHEFDDDFLPDVLDNIDLFIRGCGFIVDGQLDYVSDGDFRDSELRDNYEFPSMDVWKSTEPEHSEFYYDTQRNRPIK